MTDTPFTDTTGVTDEKGRRLPDDMTDRELLTELVVNMRAIADAVDGLAESPMVRAMMNGSNPLTAMIGGGR